MIERSLFVIAGILLFAIGTSIIYIWGLKKAQDEDQWFLHNLYSKGAKNVIKKLKMQSTISKKEVEQCVIGIKASRIYSKKRAMVTDGNEFAGRLLKKMVEEKILEEVVENNKRVYKLYSK